MALVIDCLRNEGDLKKPGKIFNAVKPTNKRKLPARNYNFKATGIVGDRRIQLRQNLKDVGYDKFPNVIINSPGEPPSKIIYKN